ncbi:MAG: MerR family transcriptional regulator [Veillonellales bacterium]
MTKNMSNFFTTGEFAKLCNVNKRTLFHYDDIGLFQPAITDKNGYRYYSYRQFDVFLIISMLKELDVPLKEMKEYIDQRTPERLLTLSSQKIAEVEHKIKKLKQIKHLLKETIAFTNKGLNVDFKEITVAEQAEEHLIRSELLREENIKDYIKWILEFTNFESRTLSTDTSFVGTMLSRENITSGNYFSNSYFFVKTTNENISNAIKPKGLYAVTYHRGCYETIGKTYERLTNYCSRRHLCLGEYSYEESLLDNIALQNENDYITQITIEVAQSR